MNRLPTPLIPIALGAAILAGLGLLLSGQQQEKIRGLAQQLQERERELERTSSRQEELDRQVHGLQAERKEWEGRSEALRSQLALVTIDLEQARGRLSELQGRVDQMGKEREMLARDMAGVKGERTSLQEQVTRLTEENSALTRSAGRLRAQLALLDRDYRLMAEQLTRFQGASGLVGHVGASATALGASTVVSTVGPTPQPASQPWETQFATAGTVELPPIIVTKDRAGISVPIRGRLIEVNESHRFVVIDRGSDDGVRVGMAFDLLRGQVPIGRAKAVRVRPNLAACDVIRYERASPLLIGDAVVQRTDE